MTHLQRVGVARQVHQLKTHPAPFAALKDGSKTFEFRKADRDFRVGDFLDLYEWDPETSLYTDEYLAREVTYILHGPAFGLPEGYCIMSVRRISK